MTIRMTSLPALPAAPLVGLPIGNFEPPRLAIGPGAPGGGSSGDRRGGGAQGADRRNAPAAPANSAMAEALRRAGLVNDKGNPGAPQDRRANRP